MNKFFLLVPLIIVSTQALAFEKQAFSPLDRLTGEHKKYYLQAWNFTLFHVKAGEVKKWGSGTAQGNIIVGEQYTSKSRSICRDYSESFVIGDETGEYQGTACKMDEEEQGWCRIPKGEAKTCALLEPEDLSDQIMNDAKSWGMKQVDGAKASLR